MRNGQPPTFTSPYDVDMVSMDTRISVNGRNGRGPLYSPYYHEMTIENDIPRGDRESRSSRMKRPYLWNIRRSSSFLCFITTLSILGMAILLLTVMITGLSYTNDPCETYLCPLTMQTCISDANGNPSCICRPCSSMVESMNSYSDQVCGSDNHTYQSECDLEYNSCLRDQTSLTIKYRGPCIQIAAYMPPAASPSSSDPCGSVVCDHGAVCKMSPPPKEQLSPPPPLLISTPPPSSMISDEYSTLLPSFINNSSSFLSSLFLSSSPSSSSSSSSSASSSSSSSSLFEVLQSDDHDRINQKLIPVCQCPPCEPREDNSNETVCGSDGQTYPNLCALKSHGCWKKLDISVAYSGPCQTCANLQCNNYASCELDPNTGKPVCQCPKVCLREENPVCGSNGKTYENECELRMSSCHIQTNIKILYRGPCGADLCRGIKCNFDAVCRDGECICDMNCDDEKVEPMCGDDHITYANVCEIKRTACVKQIKLEPLFFGICKQFMDPSNNAIINHQFNGKNERNDVENIDSLGYNNKPENHFNKHNHKPMKESNNDHHPLSNEKSHSHHPHHHHHHHNHHQQQHHPNHPHQPNHKNDQNRRHDSNDSGQHNQQSNGLSSDHLDHSEDPLSNTFFSTTTVFPLNINQHHDENVDNDTNDNIDDGSSGGVDNDLMGTSKQDNDLNYGQSIGFHSQSSSSPLPTVDCDITECLYGSTCEYNVTTGQSMCNCVFMCDNSHLDTDSITTTTSSTATTILQSNSVNNHDLFNDNNHNHNHNHNHLSSRAHRRRSLRRSQSRDHRHGHIKFFLQNFRSYSSLNGVIIDENLANNYIPSLPMDNGDDDNDNYKVCGSNNQIYESECILKKESCRLQQDIFVVDMEQCAKHKHKHKQQQQQPTYIDNDDENQVSSNKLPFDTSILDSTSRRDHYKPEYDEKDVNQSSGYCWKSPHSGSSIGNQNHPRMQKCSCNLRGSLGLDCDLKTCQCQCKPSIGGLKCNRCEAGFWGFHKIRANEGCLPCDCNKLGSVRTDCEQSTGQCVCIPGIKGLNCDQCPPGTNLGPLGCTHETFSKPRNGSCHAIQCFHGAVCVQNGNIAQCICDNCTLYTDSSIPKEYQVVCGSDNITYQSKCQLRRASCLQQIHISLKHVGPC
ncbi:agrin-like [Brevipalpus obovatus]|uniref:agrin-like n=1 Tax=Brevipalpus obovatus TaxID=246614 RepID=UPI003D9F7E37